MATTKQKDAARRNLKKARAAQSSHKPKQSPGLSTADKNDLPDAKFAFPEGAQGTAHRRQARAQRRRTLRPGRRGERLRARPGVASDQGGREEVRRRGRGQELARALPWGQGEEALTVSGSPSRSSVVSPRLRTGARAEDGTQGGRHRPVPARRAGVVSRPVERHGGRRALLRRQALGDQRAAARSSLHERHHHEAAAGAWREGVGGPVPHPDHPAPDRRRRRGGSGCARNRNATPRSVGARSTDRSA